MRNLLSLFILSICICTEIKSAVPAYAFRVHFKDKNGTLPFSDSLLFLSQKSLDRRSAQGIALDSTDLPVVSSYITQVMTTAAAVRLHNVSKWFNQIVIITNDSSKVNDIAALPMVDQVKLVARYPSGIYKTSGKTSWEKEEDDLVPTPKTRGSSTYYGLAFQQIDIMGGDCMHDEGMKGGGMDIAVLDVNFRYANTCPVFDSMNLNGRVKDVRNFARTNDSVYQMGVPNEHGMNVLGCMAANMPGTYVGTAPEANFYLYITEDWLSEQPIEEDNWLSAAERADSIGVKLINSSVGYNTFDAPHGGYAYADMNGHTSLIVNAADMAVTKGIFVCVAQGNEGTNPWHYMITPADGDSVYSVGSVNGSGMWGASGYGPTFDGRIKPDGCGMGTGAELIGGSCIIGVSNGSSFSSPMVCGAVACLWQKFPSLTTFQLRQIIRMSSSQYLNPNNTLGYGIPDFCLASSILSGVSDVKNIEYYFTVFPNPTQGEITIRSYDPGSAPFRIQLFDWNGRSLYQSDLCSNGQLTLSVLNNLPSGTYPMQIYSGQQRYSTTIRKQ